jgi:hypothetical protein
MARPGRLSADSDPGEDPDAAASAARWRIAAWALAVAGFALAMWLSCRSVRDPRSGDLRTPGVLALDAALATAIGLIFAARQGALKRPVGAGWCLAYGLWAAAVFRLSPLGPNEICLFNRNTASFDVPYILVGAGIHGFIAFLLALPYARRVLSPEGRLSPAHDERMWELALTGVVTFFVVAVAVSFADRAF